MAVVVVVMEVLVLLPVLCCCSCYRSSAVFLCDGAVSFFILLCVRSLFSLFFPRVVGLIFVIARAFDCRVLRHSTANLSVYTAAVQLPSPGPPEVGEACAAVATAAS